jgi:cell division protein FtsW
VTTTNTTGGARQRSAQRDQADRPVQLTRRDADRTDLSFVLTALALLVIGLIMSLSASSIRSAESTGSAFTLFARQFIYAALGTAALVIGWRLDYRKLKGLSYVILPVVWGALVLTLIPGIGSLRSGARRWIELGPITVQASEIAKLALIIFGADVLARKMGKLDDWRHIAVPFFVATGVTCFLILLEPDFGTMLITGLAALAMAFLAGANLRVLGGMTAGAALLAVPVMLSAGYRRARLFGWLTGAEDCLNAGYQMCQGLVGLGSGGLFGVGLGASRQKYHFLPNPETDFIFAIVGEETGLVGGLTVLFLFALLVVLGIRAARRAPDAFGFLLAAGVTTWIGLQVLINLGAVTGVLPITGVPLPLISFGGTSLLVSLGALGLVASVAARGSGVRRRA